MFEFGVLLAIALTSVRLIVLGARVIDRAASAIVDPPIPPARANALPRLPGPPRLRTARVLLGVAMIAIGGLAGVLAVVLAQLLSPAAGLGFVLAASTPLIVRRWREARWERLLEDAQISDHAA